ncbi:polyphosphate glucokinase [Gordonia araii NBRC 100433]|uniref:Polyphosphate glucokinase n=1 Tax=Gordonia araii NBRC 100433 TaxID=1073574 RepID=G7H0I1_9ACTN|nr:ROK family protein [Gordonia araii]NNG96881.1 ROK family protein [Gordonia araii NBRC 100433]GAB09356.1 polyphosphate glucokinase [Gordonia araii NBRC 100433]
MSVTPAAPVSSQQSAASAEQLAIDSTDPRYGFGVDVGGSGIKGGIVDLSTGELVGDRFKIKTPKPATPEAVAATVAEVVAHFNWSGRVGITLPAVVSNGVVRTAANIDKGWIGTDPYALFERHLVNSGLTVLNDADAAGLAESKYGLGANEVDGVVIMLTLGTGIGSAILFAGGQLLPNTELGHLQVGKDIAEDQASARAKEEHDWSYEKWAAKLSRVLAEYEKLFSPALFILGGGISRKSHKWIPLLTNQTPAVPATLLNTAGIVGAAMAAQGGLRP